MRTYEVVRTSRSSTNAEAPCEGAYKLTVPRWDIRIVDTFEEHDVRFGQREGRWIDKGEDHGTWSDGAQSGIKRRIGTKEVWAIDLDDVLAFARRVGESVIVIPANDGEPGSLDRLEIYDGYRE